MAVYKGDRSATMEALVIGDSHAAQLNYFFDEAGKDVGYRFKILTASECPPIDGFAFDTLKKYSQEPCKKQISVVKEELDNFDTIFIGALWAGHLKRKGFLESLEKFFVENSHKKIVILADNPSLKLNPVRSYRLSELGLNRQNTTRGGVANDKIREMVELQKNPNITFVDLTQSGFFDNAPFYQGELVFFDRNHINEVGSRLYFGCAKDIFSNEIR